MTAKTPTAAKRATISHAGHTHPSTAKARAACRAEMAEGKMPAAAKKAEQALGKPVSFALGQTMRDKGEYMLTLVSERLLPRFMDALVLTAADADELEEGGLGIAIIRALTDEVEIAEREGGGSRLRFVKLLTD